MTTRALFGYHLNSFLKKKELKYVVTLLLVIMTVSLFLTYAPFYGALESNVYSAARGWMFYLDKLENQAGRAFFYVFFGILASLLYSDSFRQAKQGHMLPAACSRSKSTSGYIRTGGAVSFLGAFAVFLAFFVLTQLLSFFIFPLHNTFINHYTTSQFRLSFSPNSVIFPYLFYNYPYLYNIIFMLYASLWAGILAFISYVFSLFIKNRLIIIAAPQVFLLLLSSFLPYKMSLINQLYPSGGFSGTDEVSFFLLPVITLAVFVSIFLLKTKEKGGDILL